MRIYLLRVYGQWSKPLNPVTDIKIATTIHTHTVLSSLLQSNLLRLVLPVPSLLPSIGIPLSLLSLFLHRRYLCLRLLPVLVQTQEPKKDSARTRSLTTYLITSLRSSLTLRDPGPVVAELAAVAMTKTVENDEERWLTRSRFATMEVEMWMVKSA
jgi:hypothetical protein